MLILREPESGESTGGAAVAEAPVSTAAPTPSNETMDNVPFGGEEKSPVVEQAQVREEVEPAQASAPAPVQQHSLSRLIIARAVRAGLSDEELSEFADEDSLERTLKYIERRTVPAQTDSAAVQQREVAKVEEIPDLDPEHYDEVIVKGWKTMKGLITQLHEQNAGLRKSHVEREDREYHDWFDGQIAALGADGEAMFGKGRGPSLDPKTPQYKAREKQWDALQRIWQGYVGRKERVPSREELFKQARQLAFGEQIQSAERQKVASHLQQRKKQFTIPPSQRQGVDSRSGDSKAVSSVQRKMAEIHAR